MGRRSKIPKKIVVPTTPMVEEPLKIYHTPEAFYLDHLGSLCARAETPTSLVEGKSLDEHACYVRHRIYEKGNYYGIKFNVCNAMLGLYVNYMMLLVVLSCFLSLVMGRKCKIPKKIVVPTEPMVEEPLKIYHTPEAFYLDHL